MRDHEYLRVKSLPRLPVLDLAKTLENYIEHIRPLVSGEELETTKTKIQQFLEFEGPKLQEELLRLASETPTSWLEGFWDSAYLEPRLPIPININPFFAFQNDPRRRDQISRASALIEALMKFHIRIESGQLDPDKEGNTPLCMYQYNNVFGLARIPQRGRDVLRWYNSKHICVLSCNQFYWFDVIVDGKSIPQEQIARQLRAIVSDANASTRWERTLGVGAATTASRDTWADYRAALASDNINRHAFKMIDSSLFVVCLDSSAPETLQSTCPILLHGLPGEYNRWFDKHQLIVCANGTAGINMEHAAIDGHTMLRVATDVYEDTLRMPLLGNVPDDESVFPNRLEWRLNSVERNELSTIARDWENFITETSTSVLYFTGYGSNFIKQSNLSPDGLVQMAYQLAYYRLHSVCKSTYESAQTKRFYHGRTETLRSVTAEAVAMCKGWDGFNNQQKKEALSAAVRAHGERASQAKAGKGVNRHLFGLAQLAKQKRQRLPGYAIPEIFTDVAYARYCHDTLSTSNCGGTAVNLFGFGPVVSDGLGLGYMIKPNSIHVCVTSFQSESQLYTKTLESVMHELKALLSPAKL